MSRSIACGFGGRSAKIVLTNQSAKASTGELLLAHYLGINIKDQGIFNFRASIVDIAFWCDFPDR
ncbi:MAG: hypothetical protein ACE5R6_17360 [Candidatus Heimdallarchaeota archaeon]